jgi:hypothetical protein
MNADNRARVRHCGELSYGDVVDAWHNGRLYHHGRVTKTYPGMGLFWILDARTGTRRLLDVDALEIIRAQSPAQPPARSGPESPLT